MNLIKRFNNLTSGQKVVVLVVLIVDLVFIAKFIMAFISLAIFCSGFGLC